MFSCFFCDDTMNPSRQEWYPREMNIFTTSDSYRLRVWRTSSIFRKKRGFSILEILIALVIITTLIALGGPKLANMRTRQSLSSTVDGVVNLLQRMRAQALGRTELMGAKFEAGKVFSFMDLNTNGSFDTGIDQVLSSYEYKTGVLVASGCGSNSIDPTSRPYVYIDGKGFVGVYSGGAFTHKNWQIFLYHPDLADGKKSREVEALSNGLIEKIRLGNAGHVIPNPKEANKNGLICGP